MVALCLKPVAAAMPCLASNPERNTNLHENHTVVEGRLHDGTLRLGLGLGFQTRIGYFIGLGLGSQTRV